MQLKVYSVYDSKAGVYMPPVFNRSNGEAIRSFTDALRDPNHMFHKHAADFTLFFLGQWHDGSNVWEIEPAAVNLGNGLDFISKE